MRRSLSSRGKTRKKTPLGGGQDGEDLAIDFLHCLLQTNEQKQADANQI